jgi:predicted nucleic acid-binding protein
VTWNDKRRARYGWTVLTRLNTPLSISLIKRSATIPGSGPPRIKRPHLVATPPARFYVPDLFFIECANILWKYTRRYGYPPEAAQQDVADLARLPLQSVSTADLVEGALALAMAHEITAHDAAYVALSRRLSLPLVTADEALVGELAGTETDVRMRTDQRGW